MDHASIPLLETGPPRGRRVVVLAHGAGAPMDSDFMTTIAEGLAERGCRVVRFEFDYMRRRRESGRRAAPDRAPKLLDAWRAVAAQIGRPQRLLIGGKSMGGRIASMVADELGVRGLCCLGYPFHPPGKPERLRTVHLAELRTRTLILQGSRDSFGTRDEIEGYDLSPTIRVHYLEDGDHSFKPRKASGRNLDQNLEEAIDQLDAFSRAL